ncbi:hypothetical protein CHS0354_039782 [Potamilus streckersoni]|uniref:Cytoplasmic dynein 1 intermediate chain 2-like n=1 Tax=Potamilus streckersoni TaxID=2493646 RepID=A0AAE0S038_9BIVA|nr:hypothetical protein CHS0354_039782 [Potamilus streckersoni]
MSDRKAELERKKQKLEQMRKERQEKDKMRKSKETDELTSKSKQTPSQDLRVETEELLRDLGIPPSVDAPFVESNEIKRVVTPRESLEVSAVQHPSKPGSKLRSKLTVVKVAETSIPPRESVAYSKETQTVGLEPQEKDGGHKHTKGPWDYYVLVYDNDHTDDDADTDSMDVAQSPTGMRRMPQVEMVPPLQTQEELDYKEEPPVRELSEEEKKQILMSEEFQSFFMNTSRLMERALAEEVDIFENILYNSGEGRDDALLAGERLKLNRVFFDERWSKHRLVTSLDWSTQYPELLVASYGINEEAPHEPDGVALIWNQKFKKSTPDYIFHCQSAVMSCCFAKFHPNLVVGGTYSGQIVLWDNRVYKRTPIQRTPLSASAHTHPVFCVSVVGTQNAHNLISVSNDGKMCSWSLDMLSQPQDSMELQHKQSKAVAVTSLSFLSGDVNNFVVGSEDCSVYTACRHGSKAGISELFEGHQGPVTGVDCHQVPGQIDFSPYFLTSSFDWSVKLWSAKDQKFIHSFEDNSDYVLDVQWSPIHPALFVSGDANGRLDLWNLNLETEVPTATVNMDMNVALNKCQWHQSGHSIAVGDDMGKISIFDVAEDIANPKSDEWSKFVRTLQELRQHAAEREEDSALAGLSSPLR